MLYGAQYNSIAKCPRYFVAQFFFKIQSPAMLESKDRFNMEATKPELQQTATEETQATTSTFHQPSNLNAGSSTITKD